MSLQIEEINSKRQLKEFIKFPFRLYDGNPYYVPPLIQFELSTLLKEKNPAFDHSQANYWVAKKNNKIVGRIAAISIEHELNKKQLVRFGWIDFIDDYEVSTLLFETAKKWAVSKGATSIHGPMGFTDLDFEGALMEGYDEMATQATIYNYAYYINHFSAWGLEISAKFIEMRGSFPVIPRSIQRAASIVSSRFNLKVKKFKKTKDILKYAPGIFEALNESYANLYGYHALSPKQIEFYTNQYFKFARKEYICVIVNEKDEVVGFAITLPSLSSALQKAKGKLLPFGFIHILKSFYFNKHVDLFLIGAKPEYQRMGTPSLIIDFLANTFAKNKVNYVTNGPALEDNYAVLNTWREFKLEPKIRRGIFIKKF